MVTVHMKNHWWRSVALVLALLATAPALAALQASVDQNPVTAGESLTLTLESSDGLSGSPDLSPLQQNFRVLGQSRSSSFQFINGSASRKQQWIITLMPKQEGSLLIPPLTIDGEQSQPITLTVNAADQAQATAPRRDMFMEVKATPQSVFVQQQVVYTVKLFLAANLDNGATLSEPAPPAADAIVEKLGDDRNYQTERNGVRYQVIERDYALYPQKSGSITIPPLVFEGDVVQGGFSDPFGFDPFNNASRHQRIVSTAVTINVKPQPAAFTGQQWLPAHNLQLVEQWSQTPPAFTVGQPITRTVAVMADGLTAAQLPTLTTGQLDGVKEYPDQPALKDTKASDGITGLRSEKVALIPTRPGPLTLPAIEIPWWNTTTNQLEVAHLPARTVTVAAAAGTAATPAAPAAAPSKSLPLSPLSTAAASPLSTPLVQRAVLTQRGYWPWLALLFAIGWLATALSWWWHARKRHAVAPAEESDDSLRHLENLIRASCQSDDATTCSRELLAWAKLRWPEQPPVSLTALARRCPPPLAAALLELDRVRYAGRSSKWQEGETFWQLFKQHKPLANKQRKSSADNGLRPLYSD